MSPGRRLGLAWAGAHTVLGLGRRGIFIRYRHAADLPDPPPGYPPAEALLRAAEPRFAGWLAALDRHAEALLAIGREPPPAPRWEQGWFARLDGAVAYALVRERRPARIVEVGAGHSTRFLARAVVDAGLATRILAIDPAPRARLDGLPVELRRMTVQRAGLEPFRALEPGDVLAIDSSHLAVPGSDVDMLINRVLPMLPAGLLLHVHDVLLPDPYPAAWRWRGYNEQLLVAALLTGGGFAPEFASHFVATRMPDAVAGSVAGRLPRLPGVPETSLWLEKRIAPPGPITQA